MKLKDINLASIVHKHKILIIFILSISVGATALWQGWSFYHQAQLSKAEQELYMFKAQLQAEAKKAGSSFFEVQSPFAQKKKADNFSAVQKVVDGYIQFFESQANIYSPHLIYAIELADFLIENDKQDQALELLSSLNIKAKTRSWLYYVSVMKMATLFIEKKNYTRAIGALSPLLSKKGAKSFRIEILLKLALCYQEIKDFSKARSIYSTLQNDTKISEINKERINSYYRLLLMKEKINDL